MTSYMYECTGGHDGLLQAPKRAANTLLVYNYLYTTVQISKIVTWQKRLNIIVQLDCYNSETHCKKSSLLVDTVVNIQ